MLRQWIRGLAFIGGPLAVVAGLGFVMAFDSAFEAPGPAGRPMVVLIAPGNGLNQVANHLAEAGVLNRPRTFATGARLRGKADRLRAGEYEIPARASMDEVLDILVAGQVVQHRLTVPEGLSAGEVVTLIGNNPLLSAPTPAVPEEGAVLPETYYFTRGETRRELLDRMKKARDKLLLRLWADRAPDLPLETPREAVILASIVEKETAIEEERARIAAVFLNRLRRGMRLQSDPTVIYGLTGGGKLDRSLTQSDLDSDTPYNTYRIRGLPPGPISNPGRASLEAVLMPIESDELYFVADGSGGHVFAETLEEHNRNVRRWREIERRTR